MVSVEDFNKLNVKGDKLEKVKAAAIEFEEDPTIKIEDLAAKWDIPRRSLYYYFKQLGLSAMQGKGISAAERTVRKTELSALSSEAEKITTIAFGIGGVVARRYLPTIEYLLAGGRTLEMIATDVMQWYEMKNPTETRIGKLEAENQFLKLEKKALQLKLEEASALASPNFRYLLRAKLADDFAKKLLYWNARGFRVGRRNYKAFNKMLRDLDEDLGGVEFVRVTISPSKIAALKKKHEVPDSFIREVLAKVRRS